jgi:ubiquinol-cytochrome c reductase cytochrome c subunit
VRHRLRAALTRPSRFPPAPRAALAALLGAVALVGIAAPASPGQTGPLAAQGGPSTASLNAPAKSPEPPGPGDPTTRFPSSPGLVAEGYNLYQNSCSSCHGIGLQGVSGLAPSLTHVGPGPVDFYLSTGRMPLENPREEPDRNPPAFDRTQINALIAYISKFGGPPAPATDPSRGDLAVGLHAFTASCAGCHQIVARGGLTLGAVVHRPPRCRSPRRCGWGRT